MNYWILQSNPLKFRILDYWRDYPNAPDTWSISRCEREIELGDIAYIWVANDYRSIERGIYAKAEITALPDINRPPFERELRYWVDRLNKADIGYYHIWN